MKKTMIGFVAMVLAMVFVSCAPKVVLPVQTLPADLGMYQGTTFINISDTKATAPVFQADGSNNMGIYTLDNGSTYYIDGQEVSITATRRSWAWDDYEFAGDTVLVLTINGVDYLNTYFMADQSGFPGYDGNYRDVSDGIIGGATNWSIWYIADNGSTLEWHIYDNDAMDWMEPRPYVDYPIQTTERYVYDASSLWNNIPGGRQ